MRSISLKAHFDGKQIVLDEPFQLSPDAPLVVTVLSKPVTVAADHAEWNDLAGRALARAYADSEPEYTAADIKQQ
jgi:hypothetical protein